MGPATAKLTKAQTIARRLAEDIAAGRLAPGSSLDETVIATRYGVSRTPIREAIRQLSATGLIESHAHRGAVVRSVSEARLDEMFAVMADLEALCARAAAMSMTGAERSGLRDIVEASRGVVASGDQEAYGALNDRFHHAIYTGSHNGYLADLTTATKGKLIAYRRAQFGFAGRLARSLAEHEGVLSAIEARDPARAFDTMRAHIVVVRSAVDEVALPRTA